MTGGIPAFISQNLVKILTAVTLILFGGWLFEARDGFFLSGGRFRGKFAGFVLLLLGVIAVSALTPFIDQFWLELVSQFEASRIVGIVVIAGMVAVNKSAEWNYFDRKSLIVYALGMALLFQPGPIAWLF